MALKDFIVKSNAQMMGHQTVGGYLAGPATFVIDPAAIGDDTGLVQIKGGLQVDGTTTTVNSTTLDVTDLNITVAKDAANAGAADGAGLTVDGANATLTYDSTNDRWAINKSLAGNIIGTVSDISNHSTTNLSEGTNLYFTNARADARIVLQVGANLDLSSKDTDALSEGSTNLYHTDARADARITNAGSANWNTAFGWGDHSVAGYLTSFTETDPIVGAVTGLVKADGSGNISAAVAGTDYLVTEVDTLDSVTGRGATTTNDISVNTLASTIATGTAPLTVASTTMVSNLNADKLDDKEFTDIIAEATALAIALG